MMDLDADSDFYGNEEEVAVLESRAREFDVQSYFRRHRYHKKTQPAGIKQEPPSPSRASPTTPQTKLHNPYEGQGSARQLHESIDSFLSRLPPSTTHASSDVPWIYVANPFIPRENKGGAEEAPAESGMQLQTFIRGGTERLALFSDLLRTAKEKKMGRAAAAISSQVATEREGCANDVLMLARATRVRTGKWMLFIPPALVDSAWAAVARATVQNELGIAAKVAPRRERASSEVSLICIYTYDFRDRIDIARVLHHLRHLGLVSDCGQPIYYKADAFTYLGIASGNTWGIKASLYSSRDMLSCVGKKESMTVQNEIKSDEDDDMAWSF